MIRRIFQYRDRDDLVAVVAIYSAANGHWQWEARDPAPDGAELRGGKFRCSSAFEFDTDVEAVADAVSLLNVVGEE